ncbi:MAG: hypothetical protein R3Y05_01365 [bacterium]
MEELVGDIIVPRRRFALRIGDRLPKPLRVLYYAVLFLTLIYMLFVVTKGLLDIIQRFGAFFFDKRNYYTFVFCIFGLAIGTFIVAQFFLGLDPIGAIIDFFNGIIQTIKDTIIEWVS